MRVPLIVTLSLMFLTTIGCKDKKTTAVQNQQDESFPAAMVKFSPYPENPVFEGTNAGTWDDKIRERGYILFEEGHYKMWYTGLNYKLSDQMFLGYATSADGIQWERQSKQPILPESWIEDMQVFTYEDSYFMVAEGVGDIAHLLTSPDGKSWQDQGDLIIHKVNGELIEKGPYGTPTVWVENGKNYLFYERNDLGIWLATSNDFKTWTNVQDDPVLEMGPANYDSEAVATNQIVKYKGKYYMFYHGSSNPDWMKAGVGALWTSNVAMSTDLTHWVKYPENPIVSGDHSSPILVFDGKEYTLYTMHDKVWRYEALK